MFNQNFSTHPGALAPGLTINLLKADSFFLPPVGRRVAATKCCETHPLYWKKKKGHLPLGLGVTVSVRAIIMSCSVALKALPETSTGCATSLFGGLNENLRKKPTCSRSRRDGGEEEKHFLSRLVAFIGIFKGWRI